MILSISENNMPLRDSFEKDCHYHIYNRWLRKQTLFHREEDFERFMTYTNRYIEKCNDDFDILAFCILPNHFHFVFHNKSDKGRISYFIGNVCSAYTRYYQVKYEIEKGRMYFENRFRCKQIDDEEYLQQCIFYVENNPIKHGIVDNLEERRFRSDTTLPGVKEAENSLESDLEWFSPGSKIAK